VPGVIGAWLSDSGGLAAPDDLVEALIQCLPGWLIAD
jgi:hypothetical protein